MSKLRLVPGTPDAVLSALTELLDGTGTAFAPLPADPAAAARMRQAVAPDEPVESGTGVVLTTSGSSGEPKGVVLSTAALVASAVATHERLGGPGQWLLPMQPYFVGGLQVLTRSVLAGYAPVVAADHPSFAAGVMAMTAERQYTAMVPTQLTRHLETAEGQDLLRRFNAIVIGGAAMSAELRAKAKSVGVTAIPSYGMTETGSGCVYAGVPLEGTKLRLEDELPGGVASPRATTPDPTELRSMGPDSMDLRERAMESAALQELRQGPAEGRILIAGPTLFSGYRLQPEVTAEVLRDGWFRTQDRGRVVDGRLQVVGRVDDVVISGGVNVTLTAVQARVLEHPAVADAAVLGVPDAEWGSRVVAFVVGDSGRGGPELDELRDFVGEVLPRTWAPRQLVELSELPMLASGKVDRQRLVEGAR
ncbi:AMP-binding protein [Kribbella sp. CA-293567]|uniref:AMP-binding protein n=1 Tax=Kribbella sp. CA-293567 TaxID=3002436 RepID=UPI0022DE70DD|nr:AMP-binding protein [Kribbella sp. CA-293567]WBQ06224.1 AMP-binding protein [Kribbella sp. CA-293567]